MSYLEKEKNTARETSIEAAIKELTIHRKKSTITPRNHVRKIKDYIIKTENIYYRDIAKKA